MTEPRPPEEGEGPRPEVYARLAEQEDARYAARTPPRSARWIGWLLSLALAAGVVAGAIRANPW